MLVTSNIGLVAKICIPIQLSNDPRSTRYARFLDDIRTPPELSSMIAGCHITVWMW